MSDSVATPRQVEVRYTKFTIHGIPGEKHAVFIPDNLKLTPLVLSQMCRALHKEVPSMLLTGLSSLRHPSRISTKQLRECKGFRSLMQDAKSSLGLLPGNQVGPSCSLDGCGAHHDWEQAPEFRFSDAEPSSSSSSLADVANRVLEKKIASMVSAIASAGARTNAWIFSGPQISSFEIFLQQCIEAGEANVFRLVVGHLQDQAYMESSTSKQLLQQLFSTSQPMSAQSVYRASPVSLHGDLWNPSRNTSHPEFAKHGYDHWSFDTYDDQMSEGHPVTQWPWPYGDLFILFYREDVSPTYHHRGVDWSYATRTRHDLEAIPFDPEWLAPLGYVCIGGNEPSAKRKLLQALKTLNPVIILDNTPSVPKQVSLLLHIIHQAWQPSPLAACKPFMVDGVQTATWRSPANIELIQALSASKILHHVEQEFDSAGMEEGERLALSDIVGVLDLVKRKPQLFKDTVCVVDPLHDAVEQVITQVTLALGHHHYGGPREFGVTSDVHRSLVLKAWRLHRKLSRKSRQFHRWATVLMVVISLALLLNTSVAVALVFLWHQQAEFEDLSYHLSLFFLRRTLNVSFSWSEANRALYACLLVLPVLAALLSMLQAHSKVSEKWGSLHVVASQVVSEIYRFRGGIGSYATVPTVGQRMFVRRLQDIVQQLLGTGIQEEELMEGSSVEDDVFPKDDDALAEHIDYHLYNLGRGGCLCRRLHEYTATFGGRNRALDLQDQSAPLSAEMYMMTRILPLKRHYRSWVGCISRLRMVLNFVFAVCLGIASGLGAFGFCLWLPIPLVAAACVATFTHWLVPQEMLTAVKTALTTLNSIDLKWHGSDIREIRSAASKYRLITTTERISQVIAMIFAGSTVMPDDGGDGGDNGPEGDVVAQVSSDKRRDHHNLFSSTLRDDSR